MALLKACLNGDRAPGAHPALPLSAAELAADAARAVAAGAGGLHVHPRDAAGHETLEPAYVDDAVAAIQAACPGIPVGVSTGAWVVPDVAERAALVGRWSAPDFASVNLSEDGHAEVIAALRGSGIGVEAGVATVADVAALERREVGDDVLRVLVEPVDEDPVAAVRRAVAIDRALDAAGFRAPRLHHGVELATWAVLRRAIAAGHDIRVGLEDTLVLPDGAPAAGNAELVAAAVALAR
jgi:uncharacterized protein (DUF849 family)